MKFLICATLAVAFAAVAYADDAQWQQYKTEHNLVLSGVEEDEAKAFFLKHLKEVDQNKHQQLTRSGGHDTVSIGVNEHSHMSPEKFAAGAKGLQEAEVLNPHVRRLQEVNPGKPVQPSFYPTAWTEPTGLPNPLPKSFDWRTYKAVQNSEDQSPCGDCYIFTGVAVLESNYFLRTGVAKKFSEQWVRDCIFTGSYSQNIKDSCQGGDPLNVWQLAGVTGMKEMTSSTPHQRDDKTRSCAGTGAGFIQINVTGIAMAAGEQQIMKALLAAGPLAASMDANELANPPWSSYDGKTPSIYKGQKCSTAGVNHAITLIGYGEDATNGKYWIYRNSWGSKWGGDGTFKMPRGTNACASELKVKWPCVDGACYLKSNPAFRG